MCLPCAARQARAFGYTLDIFGLILVLPDYSCAFPALEQFRASYEWQEVPLATTVPAGRGPALAIGWPPQACVRTVAVLCRLEIRLSLDGSHKRWTALDHSQQTSHAPSEPPPAALPCRVARIPPTWRLMAPLGQGILRFDVTASTRIQEVEVCD